MKGEDVRKCVACDAPLGGGETTLCTPCVKAEFTGVPAA